METNYSVFVTPVGLTPLRLRKIATEIDLQGQNSISLESEEPVALAESDRLQPLIGLYKKSSAGLLRSGFDRGERGPKMVLEEHDFVAVRATSEETQNINTPEQFDALIAALSSSKT